MSSNPLEQLANLSVESDLHAANNPVSGSTASDDCPQQTPGFWQIKVTPVAVGFDVPAGEAVQSGSAPIDADGEESCVFSDVCMGDFAVEELCLSNKTSGMPPGEAVQLSPTPIDADDEVSATFPEVLKGDFTGVVRCLDNKTSSQVDLVSFIGQSDEAGDGDCEMADELTLVPMEDLLTLEVKKEPPSDEFGPLLSCNKPAEASDQSVLPSLPVLQQQQQRPRQQQQPQQQRLTVNPPQLNSFDAPPPEVPDASPPTLLQPPPPLPLSSLPEQQQQQPSPRPTIVRRRTATQRQRHLSGSGDKSYLAVCQKNRIFDSGARAKYEMDQELGRDELVASIVDYVKFCLDPERDRVHRFLMVMLVDGQTESGPYWRFFQDAVYFCDARKNRVIGQPAAMFHIRQSAYVGLLWGKFKGNECFDYATLGDAIKSVKSKYNGEQYFVDPDFGSSVGKPKRLFQFGPTAFDEICRYHRQRSAAE